MNVVLSTAYWPNLHYMFYVLNAENVAIEQFENFQKQSFRNRTTLLSANGPLELSIPIKKRALKELSKDITISYQENWQIKHWRAIESAYKNSPYFDFFEDDIKYFYSQGFENLLLYNYEQLNTVLKLLRLKKQIVLTTNFEAELATNKIDLRSTIHPKVAFTEDLLALEFLMKPYYQTFENKFPFQPNLSILDLLFNQGLESKVYLQQKHLV
jgi:hypothetical protein